MPGFRRLLTATKTFRASERPCYRAIVLTGANKKRGYDEEDNDPRRSAYSWALSARVGTARTTSPALGTQCLQFVWHGLERIELCGARSRYQPSPPKRAQCTDRRTPEQPKSWPC